MNKASFNLLINRLLLFCSISFVTIACSNRPELTLKIDGSEKYQTMDGFGVNINPAWWYKGNYGDASNVQPAIDLLVDSLGATIFRAVIEEIDWEAENDDNDPGHFNWDYYNKVFSSGRFQGVWNTLRYLNQKGISDNLMISLMGAPPASAPLTPPEKAASWMGGTDYTIAANMEDEMAESIAALLYYMRNTAKIKYHLVSPMNETDIQSMTKSEKHPGGIVEGPNVPDATQYVRIIRKLAEKLDAAGMADIRFVAPDAGGDKLFGEVLAEIIKDPYLINKMAHWGVHQYGKDSENYRKLVSREDNPVKSFWVTETAGIDNLLGQMDDDVRAFIFWDGYDCVYQHGRRNGYGNNPPNDWVFWEDEEGLPLIGLDTSSMKWIPRKQFYEHAQLMKFIKPGAVRIGVSGSDSTLAGHTFLNPDGSISVVGRNNNNKEEMKLTGILTNLPDQQNFRFYYTDSNNSMVMAEVTLTKKGFKVLVPAAAVFTITSLKN